MCRDARFCGLNRSKRSFKVKERKKETFVVFTARTNPPLPGPAGGCCSTPPSQLGAPILLAFITSKT